MRPRPVRLRRARPANAVAHAVQPRYCSTLAVTPPTLRATPALSGGAPGSVLLQAVHDEQGQRLGDVAERPVRGLRHHGQLRRERGLRRGADERTRPGEQLVRKQPHGIQIDAVIHGRVGGELLGRHVGWRADCRARGGAAMRRRGRAQGLRDTEIGHERVHARREDVVGLDVAMHDATGVCIGERVDDVVENAHHVARCEPAAPGERTAQRLAVDVRHRKPEEPMTVASGEQGHDVRMLELGGQLNLPPEALHVHAGRTLRREHLYHDRAIEGPLGRHEHPGHTGPTEFAFDRELGRQGGLQAVLKISHGAFPQSQRHRQDHPSLRATAPFVPAPNGRRS